MRGWQTWKVYTRQGLQDQAIHACHSHGVWGLGSAQTQVRCIGYTSRVCCSTSGQEVQYSFGLGYYTIYDVETIPWWTFVAMRLDISVLLGR